MPLTGEEALQRAWRGAAAGSGELRLRCQVSQGGRQPGAGMSSPSLHAELTLQPSPLPQGVGGRPVLYQVVARHGYSAQGPEDLALQPGDTVDVLCEGRAGTAPTPPSPCRGPGADAVSASRCGDALTPPAVDQAWLEGHCDGRVGIFPKCFVVPAGRRT